MKDPMKKATILVLISILLAACAPGQTTRVEATVLEIDPVERTYTAEAQGGGALYLIRPSGDFNLEAVQAGEVVVLEITAAADGKFVRGEVEEDPEATVEELDDQAKNKSERGRWCDNGQPSGEIHPQAETIAAEYSAYGLTEQWVMIRFCQGYGFGEIKIALNLSIAAGVDKDYVFELKVQLGGWGRVRQELGVTGNPHPDNPGKGPK